MIDDRKAAAAREDMKGDMESLIHHFKLFTEGYSVPEGETYAAVGAPKGELGIYLISMALPPYRLKCRALASRIVGARGNDPGSHAGRRGCRDWYAGHRGEIDDDAGRQDGGWW
jgi:hypothetical protein